MRALQALPPDASAAGTVHLRMAGVLAQSPFRGALYRCALSVIPLSTPDEYAEVTQFECRARGQVLMSPPQRCDVLKTLLTELHRHLPMLTLFVVRAYGPEEVQLPRELLAEDVLLTHAPLDMLPWLLDQGARGFAVIEHGLLADVVDRGGNEIEIWLLGLDAQGQQAAQTFLAESVVLQGLAGLRCEPMDEAQVRAPASACGAARS